MFTGPQFTSSQPSPDDTPGSFHINHNNLKKNVKNRKNMLHNSGLQELNHTGCVCVKSFICCVYGSFLNCSMRVIKETINSRMDLDHFH